MAKNEENDAKKTDETKKPDEAKDATTEATSKDKADALAEKTLAAEKKRARSETKIALWALGLMLLSMFYIYLIAFNDKITDSGTIIVLFLGGIFLSLAALCIASVSAIKGRAFHWKSTGILWLTYVIPLLMIFPLSKYHNQNQIQRDKKIVETFQITVWEDVRKIKILLPDEHESKHSYLEKVLSIGWTNDKKSWKNIAVPCRRGNEYWHEATIDKLALDQTGKKACFILFFDHAWEDYEATKEVPLPLQLQ